MARSAVVCGRLAGFLQTPESGVTTGQQAPRVATFVLVWVADAPLVHTSVGRCEGPQAETFGSARSTTEPYVKALGDRMIRVPGLIPEEVLEHAQRLLDEA